MESERQHPCYGFWKLVLSFSIIQFFSENYATALCNGLLIILAHYLNFREWYTDGSPSEADISSTVVWVP